VNYPTTESESDPVTESETAFQSIDPRQITVSRITGLIFAAVVGGGFLIGLTVYAIASGFSTVWLIVAVAGGLFTLFLFWTGLVWPVWEYERTSWRLSDTGLEIRRGVFWQHQISVPVARVQHADVTQGPLQRQYELGKLIVNTAGTQNASVELDGIAHAKAIELRNQIVSQRISADVV
jgi:membrane protein YdbS with pleckstrin-like domain